MKNYKITSLSILVGSRYCNANCKHCAGKIYRKNAPKKDTVNIKLIEKTLRDSYKHGARYLSISSTGEPTLSPLSITKVLKLANKLKHEGIKFSPINLYSNGIKIGNSKLFSDYYLPLWKSLGLTRLYITIYNLDPEKNAKVYNINSYPEIKKIISRIHSAGLLMRANLILSKKTINTTKQFVQTISALKKLGIDMISAWPIKDKHDNISKTLSPSKKELKKMQNWLIKNPDKTIKLLLEENNILRTKKLTLFPDGSLSDRWCNN